MEYKFIEEFGQLKLYQISDDKGNSIYLSLKGFDSLADLLGNPSNRAGDPLKIEKIYFVGDTLYVETETAFSDDGETLGGTYVIDPIKGEVQSVITDGYLGN